ncbi:hypothetical protein [Edaphobacter flagellatus]|uniref:hypothetical protein n=1 Tax=Edaphobacter flagellatus TaxID=1933044 RepID=UPI0021B1A28C|nr:hypothetical protein [Edaphobacter flagellatus]
MTLKNLSAVALAGVGMLAQGPLATAQPVSAQPTPQARSAPAPLVTAVMVVLTVKSGIAREDVMKVMPREVRETVKLYLDGKIEQWYSRGDGKGVVFFVRAKTVEEAKSIMEGLPLHAAGYMEEEYMPVGPLMPLRFLLAGPPSEGEAGR